MALGDPYITAAELRTQGNYPSGSTDDGTELDRVADAVTRAIERYCGRQFNDAGSATARKYVPDTWNRVCVDDFSTTTGLVVKSDTGNDGNYTTTISSSYYSPWPFNTTVAGQTGYPYREIRLHNGQQFVYHGHRPTVEVTAQWGWAAVPADVKTAALIWAAKVFGRKFSHNGVIGFGEFVVRVGREVDPDVKELLAPYRLVVGLVA